MELRQLRYLLKIIELGSFSRAASALNVVTSALSQQISRLERELKTQLLQRTSTGVTPTDAGLAFIRQAQLAVRHADDAVRAARLGRLSGHVSIGLAPSTATVLGSPLMRLLRERYPDVRLRFVESLSGDLANMLNARQLDLAVLFSADPDRRWSIVPLRWSIEPLLEERLFVMGSRRLTGMPKGRKVRLTEVGKLPLLLPSASHNLRLLLNSALAKVNCEPQIVAEIDGLAMLMKAVSAGLGATIQPGAAAARISGSDCAVIEIADAAVRRSNLLISLPDEELSPAARAARTALFDLARQLVLAGSWLGASLHDS
jgi:LysR family tcuABC transcriptional regulator